MDNEAVTLIRPRDEMVGIGVVNHFPEFGQEGRDIARRGLLDDDIHDGQHAAGGKH